MVNIKHNDLLTDMHIDTIFGRVLEVEELHDVIANSYKLFIEEYERKLTILYEGELLHITHGTRKIIRDFDAGTENYIMGHGITDTWLYRAFCQTSAPIQLENLIPKMNNVTFAERETLVLGIVNNKYAVVYFESKESNPIIHTYKLTSLFGYDRPLLNIDLKQKRLDDFINDIVIKRNKEKKQKIKDTELLINSLSNAVVNSDEETLTFESLMSYIQDTQN